jgi:hypothetical protein
MQFSRKWANVLLLLAVVLSNSSRCQAEVIQASVAYSGHVGTPVVVFYRPPAGRRVSAVSYRSHTGFTGGYVGVEVFGDSVRVVTSANGLVGAPYTGWVVFDVALE